VGNGMVNDAVEEGNELGVLEGGEATLEYGKL
jgi:hypothetical protein